MINRENDNRFIVQIQRKKARHLFKIHDILYL